MFIIIIGCHIERDSLRNENPVLKVTDKHSTGITNISDGGTWKTYYLMFEDQLSNANTEKQDWSEFKRCGHTNHQDVFIFRKH